MCVHWLCVWVLICSVCIFVRFYLHFPSMFACGRFAGLVGWSFVCTHHPKWVFVCFFRSFMSIARFKGIRFRLFCIQWRSFCIHAHDNSDCRFKGEGELLELPWNKSYIWSGGKKIDEQLWVGRRVVLIAQRSKALFVERKIADT